MAKRNEAKLSMLIRTDALSVCDAFVNPKKIAKFWLKRTSGPMVAGSSVEWEFKVPGAVETTHITRLLPGSLIEFTWSDGIAVRIEMEPATRKSCIVRVSAGPFGATSKAVDAAEGFCIVLCDLKIWLETGKSPNLVRDKAKLIAGSGSI